MRNQHGKKVFGNQRERRSTDMAGPEAKIERKYVKYVNEDGGWATKGSVRNNRAWPDRPTYTPNGGHFFIEFKAPGKKPTPLQYKIHDNLRAGGHRVYVVDNYEEAIQIYEEEKIWWKNIWKTLKYTLQKISNCLH